MGLTLSEQSYTRYLEGKLRETFGFSGTPEAECFLWFTLNILTVLTMFRPKWQVVLCLLVKHITSRHKTCHSFSWHNREGGRLFCRPANEFMGLTLSEQSYTQISGGQTQRNIRLQRNTWSQMFLCCPQISGITLFWQCFVQNGRWSCACLWKHNK